MEKSITICKNFLEAKIDDVALPTLNINIPIF